MQDYNKILIFSGTTEGRSLSEMLEKNCIKHTVFVATEYGEMLQPKGEYTLVEEGRKTESEIRNYALEAEVVVDATHPYAALVSENIKRAVNGTKAKLIRVLRDSDDADMSECISYFDSVDDCSGALEKETGNILFTTGSKDLSQLCYGITDKSQIYARVLPTTAGLEACERAGIRFDHIIALQGPFTKELNLSLIRQYGIEVLVTKDSGNNGGFHEKIEACTEAGIKVFCIKRPVSESGVSTRRAFEIIEKYREDGTCERVEDLCFNIIGAGMGGEGTLTLDALDAIKGSRILFGAERIISKIDHPRKYPEYLAKDILATLEKLLSGGEAIKEIAILFSGDIGFYSGAAKFEEGLKEWDAVKNGKAAYSIKRFPGISSVSFFAARLGVSYSDAECISLHGRNGSNDLASAVEKIIRSKKSFVLLSSADDISKLAEELIKRDCRDMSFYVAEKLSAADETITEMSLQEAFGAGGKGLFTLYIENRDPQKKPLIPTTSDEEFIRNKTPMTKGLIRHEVVRLLNLKEGDVLYDIGSGTGSVAIETAGLSGSLKVYSFEKNPEAIQVQRENIEKFSATNIELIEGEVPETLSGIQGPDAVFIGGSGGRLSEILECLRGRSESEHHRNIRVVMTAVSLETMEEISRLKDNPWIENLEIQQITSSRASKAGEYHLMRTENSVMVAGFDLMV